LKEIDIQIAFHFRALYKLTNTDHWPKYTNIHFNLIKLRNNTVQQGKINLHPIVSNYQNQKLKELFSIRQSTLAFAGEGLFAKKKIQRNSTNNIDIFTEGIIVLTNNRISPPRNSIEIKKKQ
jgi:hypothetical protein